MPLVLVTQPEFGKALEVFQSVSRLDCRPAPAAEDELAAAIRSTGARHVVVGGRPYRGALYGALERGGVIARFGVGHDGIDKAQAAARGLLCTNTPDVLTQSVAEHAMLLVMAAARRLPALARSIDTGIWTQPVGMELAGKTLAIVGCGRIGRATARIARHGFGMRIVGFARTRAGAEASRDPDFDTVTDDFGAAVRDAHFVSVHIPASEENVRAINPERLALCRPDAWLVNTARGAVVDEAALFDALAAGRLAGAALDVFTHEPYRPVDPARDLRTLPNVILTPHVGSHTTEANRAMATRALHNIRLAEEGRLAEMDLLSNPGAACV
jgi:lactate dehydrogenase-like 2-hydroxyacid dehydrogenase